VTGSSALIKWQVGLSASSAALAASSTTCQTRAVPNTDRSSKCAGKGFPNLWQRAIMWRLRNCGIVTPPVRLHVLFASKNSVTKAHLHAVVDAGYEEDRFIDPKVAEYLHISEAFEHAAEFDLIHSHYDFMALTYTRLVGTPVLTTIHGFSSPQILPVYEKYRDGYFVSVSNSDRASGLNYLAVSG